VATPGLREIKKRETVRSIEVAALDLLDELGYDAVTVEAICQRAMVSNRTFFNYFANRDDAVLGHHTLVPNPAATVQRIESGGPVLLALRGYVSDVLADVSTTDLDLDERRRRYIGEQPALAARRLDRILAEQAFLADEARRLLELDDRIQPGERDRLARAAYAIVITSIATGLQQWSTTDERHERVLADAFESAFDAVLDAARDSRLIG
jgi:AcrR family transcriptional regulator